MKQILWMLVLSLVSFSSWADDDEIKTCNIDVSKDFSILVDYGEVGSLSTQDADDDDDDDFEEEVLYITTRDSKKPIKLWSNDDDEKDAVFYDPSIDDDDDRAEIRIDFIYNSQTNNGYLGDFSYYLKKNGKWDLQSTVSKEISLGTFEAQALIEEDDDREELHNLRCSDVIEPIDPIVPLELCDLFPQPAQAWKSNSTLTINEEKGGVGLYPDYYISGWSEDFKESCGDDAKLHNCQGGPSNGVTDKVVTSFGHINDWSDFNSCEIGTCAGGNTDALIDTPPDINVSFTSKLEVTIDDDDFEGDCGNGSKCNAYLDPTDSNHIIVEINQDLKSLTVHDSQTMTMSVIFKDGVKVKNYIVNGIAHTKFETGKFYFNKLLFKHTDLSVEFEPEVQLLFASGNPEFHITNEIEIIQPDDQDQLLIYAPKGTVNINSADTSQLFRALIVGKEVKLDKNTYVKGAVSTNKLTMNAKTSAIIGDSACFSPKPKIASINIKPNNFHLTCEDSKYVDVEAFNDKGELMKEFDAGEVLISLESITSGQLSFSGGGFNTATNSFQFSIDSKSNNNYGPVPVKAELIDDSNVSDTSDVVFVPLKFNINDGKEIELIAGKEKDESEVTIKTLACTADGKVYTGNYDKTLTDAHLIGHSFAPGYWSDNQSDFTFSATFTGGVTSDLTLQFDDAGQYSGELIDSVSCDDFYDEGVDVVDCPSGEAQQIKGELKFKARPWTFAICDYASNSGGDASNSGSDAFLPAGKEFDLTAKPVIYSSSLDSYRLTQKAKADEFCKLSVTDNFFKNDPTFNSKVELSHSVATPPSADGGQDGSLSYAGAQNNYAGTSSIPLSDISVTEVGSFNFAASGNDTSFYAGILGGIDIGQREIGRFYPAYFSIEKIKWTVEDDLGDKNYLGKPFEQLDVEVGAYALGSTSTLQNYHLFDPGLQASFAAKGDSVVNNELRFSADLSTIKWSAVGSDSYWILNDSDAQVTRSLVKTETVSGKKVMFTKPNGPFNDGSGTTTTDFGFTISGSDPVSFSDSSVLLEQAFPTQPTVRYGRMVMGSSGGTSEHTLNVPLRVEYWNGSAFVVNGDDDLSKLSSNASHVCKQILWQDDEDSGSDSALSGVSSVQSVSSGLYQGLQATPNSSNEREQARFWIMLDDTATTPVEHTSPQRLLTDVDCGASGLNQPWLQYNWRGQGDEDPSTVATFGIFRGNDKVIFRAEPNLVGN